MKCYRELVTLERKRSLWTHLVAVKYGSIANQNVKWARALRFQMQELSYAGLEEVVGTPTIYENGEVSVVDDTIETESF